jgi:hypothetical protein
MTAQTAWKAPNVVGHSIDPYTGKMDHTEGFGAFDSILGSYSLGRRTIDIGGGQHDTNSAYLEQRYQLSHQVYDPFMRSDAHNQRVLKLATHRPFDSCTSISVLNVIDSRHARLDHLRQCRSVIKETGKVYIKVWPGNGRGISVTTDTSYQSNLGLKHYVAECEAIFGRRNVKLDLKAELIICTRLEP